MPRRGRAWGILELRDIAYALVSSDKGAAMSPRHSRILRVCAVNDAEGAQKWRMSRFEGAQVRQDDALLASV